MAIGNAAQTLHPVAGQEPEHGPARCFVLADALRTGCTPRSLQDFARHRLDRAVTIGVTDFLPRVFALPSPLAAHARGASLTALACLPPLKHALAPPDDVRHAALRPGLGQRLAGPGGAPAPGACDYLLKSWAPLRLAVKSCPRPCPDRQPNAVLAGHAFPFCILLPVRPAGRRQQVILERHRADRTASPSQQPLRRAHGRRDGPPLPPAVQAARGRLYRLRDGRVERPVVEERDHAARQPYREVEPIAVQIAGAEPA